MSLPTSKIYIVDKDGNVFQVDPVTLVEIKVLDAKKATADTGLVDEDHTI